MALRADMSSSATARYIVNTRELLKPRLARFRTVRMLVNSVLSPLYSMPSLLTIRVLMTNGPRMVTTR